MRAVFATSAVLVLAGCGSVTPTPAPTPSVQVGTTLARHGSLPSVVTAYGSVAPSVSGTQSFSEPQPGQVTRLMVAPGSTVRAGQPLAVFVTAPSARSTYHQAVAALAAAQKQRATTAQLLTQQLATQDQLVQADKAVSDAQTALSALRADGAGSASHMIVAPFAGVVTTVAVAQGDRTQPGAAILTVARAGGIVVTVGIDPAQRAALAVGQAATLKRLWGGGDLIGRVIRVDGALNATSRLVDVDLTFPAGSLLPGEAMQVAIETGQVSGWVVPHAAVVTAGGAARVFQVAAAKGGARAKAVPVTIRLSSDKGDVVDGALDARRPLIVDGAYQVSDGDVVRRAR